MRASGVKLSRVGAGAQPTEQPRRVIALVWLSFFVMGMPGFAQTIVYVNQSATGAETGQLWKDAFTDLQDALADVRERVDCTQNGSCEIWVAEGTYHPDQGSGDRKLAFDLVDGVAIYGGFGGWESHRDQRKPALHETVLSGDLDDNDDVNEVPLSDCCTEHPEPGCDNAECWSTVQSALDYPYGPDYCTEDTPWSLACASVAESICCDLCHPTRCENSYSVVSAYDVSASTVLDGVTATSGEANGGLEEPVETADSLGAGLYGEEVNLTLANCKVLRNGHGGGVYIRRGDIVVQNCRIEDNRGNGITGEVVDTVFDVYDSTFARNEHIGLIVDARRIERCRFIENGLQGFYANGLFFAPGPTVKDCTFVGNGGGWGGGMNVGQSAELINCRFFGNHGGGGGGLYADGGSTVLINCIFSGNTANYGAAVDTCGSSIQARGCIFAMNTAIDGSVGACGSFQYENCVFWNNLSTRCNNAGDSCIDAGISVGDGSKIIHYSLVHNSLAVFPGIGNIDVDPMFVDPDGRDNIIGTEDDDYRLLPTSPLINRGDPDPDSAPLTDADGHARILRGRIDIGAYEFGIGDYDWSRFVDIHDAAAWPDCMTGPLDGPYTDGCEAFDFVADETFVIDLHDFAGFQQAMTDGSPIVYGPATPEKK